MTIYRAIQAQDYAEWHILWQGYQTFYQSNIADTTTQQTFARFLEVESPLHAIVAIHQGQLMGFVHFIQHASTWTTQDYCYLQDLYVAPTCRGKHIGRELIEQVYLAAQDLNCSRVYWLTQENNYTARMLYDRVAERSGFIQYRKML